MNTNPAGRPIGGRFAHLCSPETGSVSHALCPVQRANVCTNACHRRATTPRRRGGGALAPEVRLGRSDSDLWDGASFSAIVPTE